jgi:hypothetical protein
VGKAGKKGARAGAGAAKNGGKGENGGKGTGGKAPQNSEDRGKDAQNLEEQIGVEEMLGCLICDEVIERTKAALVDGQVAGPWLTMEGTSSAGKASSSNSASSSPLDGSDALEHLRAAICETVYKHPGMPEEALAHRFHMLNPRTLGSDVSRRIFTLKTPLPPLDISVARRLAPIFLVTYSPSPVFSVPFFHNFII